MAVHGVGLVIADIPLQIMICKPRRHGQQGFVCKLCPLFDGVICQKYIKLELVWTKVH